MMFSLVLIYPWIFLKPFRPQLSSSLPAQCGVKLCPHCAGDSEPEVQCGVWRGSALLAWGAEGVSPPAAACLPLVLRPWSSCSSF